MLGPGMVRHGQSHLCVVHFQPALETPKQPQSQGVGVGKGGGGGGGGGGREADPTWTPKSLGRLSCALQVCDANN